jgi:hypothetical protein
MMMGVKIAVVPRAVIEHGHFARFADRTQRFERAMDSRERDVRVQTPYIIEDSLSSRMISCRQQCLDYRQALWRHCQSTSAAAPGELSHPLTGIASPLAAINHLQFHNSGDNNYHLGVVAVNLRRSDAGYFPSALVFDSPDVRTLASVLAIFYMRRLASKDGRVGTEILVGGERLSMYIRVDCLFIIADLASIGVNYLSILSLP